MSKAKSQANRIDVVADWLAEGHTLASARRRASAEWKLSNLKAADLVNQAAAALRDRYAAVDRHELVARVLGTLEHTAHQALESGQLNTVVQALALVAKLAALEPQPLRR